MKLADKILSETKVEEVKQFPSEKEFYKGIETVYKIMQKAKDKKKSKELVQQLAKLENEMLKFLRSEDV